MYGLLTKGVVKGELMLAMKATKCISNPRFLLDELKVRPLVGGIAGKAAEYQDVLGEVVCRGLAGQLAYDQCGRVSSGPGDKGVE